MEQDIRWIQRFKNYKKALDKLTQAVEYFANPNENSNKMLEEILKEGLIQRFEYTHELSWKVMKDYAEYQGNFEVGGSRDATREGFKLKLITNGNNWMDMIGSRNRASHTYDEVTADEIFYRIINEYHLSFIEFKNKMEEKLIQEVK